MKYIRKTTECTCRDKQNK